MPSICPEIAGGPDGERERTAEELRLHPQILHVIVTCCTYQRLSSLRRLLQSWVDLKTHLITGGGDREYTVSFMVIDNDAAASARETVTGFAVQLGDLHYVVEPQLGLASVRNRALREAHALGGSHLLFVDDDEAVDPAIVDAYAAAWRQRPEVAIWIGAMPLRFNRPYPRWITQNKLFNYQKSDNFFRHPLRRLIKAKAKAAPADAGQKLIQARPPAADAERETVITSTGNAFIPLTVYAGSRLTFNARFNALGNEDTDFFTRARALGYRIAACPAAVAWHMVDERRANVRWILRRRFTHGYNQALIELGERPRALPRFTYAAIRGFFALHYGIVTLLNAVCGPTVMLNTAGLCMKNLGRAVGALRLRPPQTYQ